jgi:N-acetylneuraminate synthase
MKHAEYKAAAREVRRILTGAGIPLAKDAEVEVVDCGLGNYRRIGLGIVVRINGPEYCSKWLTLLPGQTCPEHYHAKKKETFFCHKGVVELKMPRKTATLRPGEQYTLAPGTWHSFTSKRGAIIEEVSTHDENADSIFRDPKIVRDVKIEA